MQSSKARSSFNDMIAETWDYFYGDRDNAAVDFYLRQFSNQRPLQNETLDVGCGTGRFLIPLLERGYRGIGIDHSKTMVDLLKEKAKQAGVSPTVLNINVEDFEPQNQFDGIVAFYFVFYLRLKDEIESFFKTAYDLLASGGVIFFNNYNAFDMWKSDQWTATHTYKFEDGFGRVEYTFIPENSLMGLAEMSDFRLVSKAGIFTSGYDTRKVRFYTMTELTLMLEKAGFENVRNYIDLEGTPATESTRCHGAVFTVARKP